MENLGLLLISIVVVFFALVARRIVTTIIAAPMVFPALGANAVWISALLHEVTSAPLAKLYGHHVQSRPDLAEHRAVPNEYALNGSQPETPK